MFIYSADASGETEEEVRPEDMLLWHPYGIGEDKTEAYLEQASITAKGDLQMV